MGCKIRTKSSEEAQVTQCCVHHSKESKHQEATGKFRGKTFNVNAISIIHVENRNICPVYLLLYQEREEEGNMDHLPPNQRLNLQPLVQGTMLNLVSHPARAISYHF